MTFPLKAPSVMDTTEVAGITVFPRLHVRFAAGLALSDVHVNTVESRSATIDTFPVKATLEGETKDRYNTSNTYTCKECQNQSV